MILGINCVGMLVGFAAACIALFAGYSILMALWFYALFGCLATLAVGTVTFAIYALLSPAADPAAARAAAKATDFIRNSA